MFTPEPASVAVYEQLYPLYKRLYFAFGRKQSQAAPIGDVLPQLRHIAAQVLCESGTLGLLGGLIGASLAVLLVIGVALARQWTAILDPGAAFAAPLAGAAMGVLAGLYPALRASRIEPLEALRS